MASASGTTPGPLAWAKKHAANRKGESSPRDIAPPRHELTREEVRVVHGIDRFAAFDAEKHLAERMENLVLKQREYELDYSYMISNAATGLRLRRRRLMCVEFVATMLLDDFHVDNAQECIEVAVWLMDAYLCTKRPDAFATEQFTSLLAAIVSMVTKTHAIAFLTFKTTLAYTEAKLSLRGVKELEADILSTLGWKLFPPLVPTVVEHLGALLGCPEPYVDAAKKRWHVCRVSIDAIKFSPAVLAAGALLGVVKLQPAYVRYVFDEEEAAHLCHSTAAAVRAADALLVVIEKEEARRVDGEKRKKEEDSAATTTTTTTSQGGKKRKKVEPRAAPACSQLR